MSHDPTFPSVRLWRAPDAPTSYQAALDRLRDEEGPWKEVLQGGDVEWIAELPDSLGPVQWAEPWGFEGRVPVAWLPDGGFVVAFLSSCGVSPSFESCEAESAWYAALPEIALEDSSRPCVQVWAYGRHPERLKKIAWQGGDEDWVALFPVELVNEEPLWCEVGTSFGVCSVEVARLPDGSQVRVGCHA